MVMDERAKVSNHLNHQDHHGGVSVGSGDHELDREETTTMEGLSSTESSSPPPSTNGTVGDGSTGSGPVVNVYLIGLEFVRQYYTVLHQGPLYLHRFYSDDSSFVHPLDDDCKAVYGQVEIRERIQQLNFCNCVAKILQVDSHETVGNGVVIQVRGELSNNGQPMRRFMQTFVLAPQSPKRFYVRNDIFHYQDELPTNNKDEFKPIATVPVDLTANDADDEKSDADDELGNVNNESNNVVNNVQLVQHASSAESQPTVNIVNEVSINENQDEQQDSQKPATQGFVSPSQASEGEKLSISTASGSPGLAVKETVATSGAVSPIAISSEAPSSGPVAAKTYANLFKSGPTTSSSGTPSAGTPAPGALSPPSERNVRSPPNASPQPPASESTASTSVAASTVVKNLPPTRGGHYGSYGRDRGFRERRENRERLASRSSAAGNDDAGSVDGDGGRRMNTNYPDSHQLFVGNLPHSVTVNEIKGIFEVYGKVAEVKILKPNQKNAGSKVPYFCFVVFEEAAAAGAAINEKHKITMRMHDGTNRRLNVEEKRPRGMADFSGGSSNYQRDSRDNVSNPPSGGTGGNGGLHQFRRGDGGGNNPNRPSNPPPLTNEHRNQGLPRGRTFRPRGGGGGGAR